MTPIDYPAILRFVIARFPAVMPHLTTRARLLAGIKGEYKTYEFFLRELERMINNVYTNNLGGEFISLLENLVLGQISQAFEQAWADEEGQGDVPEYLRDASQTMVLEQYAHINGLYRDIVDARVDETPVEPLLSRAALWARQWDVAYKEGLRLIQLENGGNMIWRKGNTENGCNTCARLDGIVMSAREWQELDVHPRGYPNPKLECEGGGPVNNCDCTLEPTDQRRSPKAYNTVMNIVSK